MVFFSCFNYWSRFYNSMTNLKKGLCCQRNVNHFSKPIIGLVKGQKDCKNRTSVVYLPKELFVCDSLVTFLLSKTQFKFFFQCLLYSFFSEAFLISWYVNASLFNFILSMLLTQLFNLTCVFVSDRRCQEGLLQIFT